MTSASSRAFWNAAFASWRLIARVARGAASPVICKLAWPSARYRRMSRRGSPGTRPPRLAMACSTRAPHSVGSNRCIHSGAPAARPARRKGPVKGRAQVVDGGPVRNQPLGDRPRLQLGLGLLEEVAIVLGVVLRDDLDFGALDKLLTRVRAGRLQQAIVHDR